MYQSMREVILDQHNQIQHSQDINKDVAVVLPADGFDSMILAGMGGSGHPGDLINALGVSKLPLFVHRNYDLPLEYLNQMGLKKPLVITSSYSGNTEESLTAYKEAKENNIPILASAAGGQLEEWAAADNIPFCKIDFTGMQPRHTLFAAFTGIYTALKNSDLASDITEDLTRVTQVLETITPTLETLGQDLASKIKNKTPVYNSGDNLGFAAKNFKIQTNENAKYPAFWNTFPELNHNELVGFSALQEANNPNEFIGVILRDDTDHPRVKARIDVTASLYKQWGVDVEQVNIPGKTKLEKIFYAVTLGLWTTMSLAESYGIDPVPVHGVEDFKAKLKQVAGDI